MRLLNVLTGNAGIPGLIFSDRLRQQIVDRPETLLPVNGNVVPGQRVVLLFGHQTMSAIQHRFHFAQCGFQPVNARLDVSERFFLANHSTDLAECALHLVTFARGNVDADRPFQVLEHLKIGHLYRAARLVGMLLLIKFCCFIKTLLDIFNQRRIIRRRPDTHAYKQAKESNQQRVTEVTHVHTAKEYK